MKLADIKHAFDLLTRLTCGELPEDWEIRFCFEQGAGGIELIDPDGNLVTELPEEDMSLAELLVLYVNFARLHDGLQVVECEGWDWAGDLSGAIDDELERRGIAQ